MMDKILIVDDERSARKGLYFILRSVVDKVYEADSQQQALDIIKKQEFDLIISDLRMPNEEQGLELVRQIKKMYPLTPVLMITAFGSVDTAVKAMKNGADDFISKDFSREEISLKVNKMLEIRKVWLANIRLSQQIDSFREKYPAVYEADQIIGESSQVKQMLGVVARVAKDNDSTVLITGESGTGKELVARAVHQNNEFRNTHKFVVVDVANIPATLLESQLFGHEKGAFTNAHQQHKGLFELASGGTAFLDEIGDFPLELQVKLLRFMQEKTFTRVGGEKTISADVRIVAATNKNIDKLVGKERFREDLYYRLNVIKIHMPALRNRKEDIPALIAYFKSKFDKRKHRELSFPDEVIQEMAEYSWPGNIRQLKNFMESLYVLCPTEEVNADDLNFDSQPLNQPEVDLYSSLIDLPIKEARQQLLDEFEYNYLQHHLELCNGNISRLAEQVGESREGLSKKIKRYGLKEN